MSPKSHRPDSVTQRPLGYAFPVPPLLSMRRVTRFGRRRKFSRRTTRKTFKRTRTRAPLRTTIKRVARFEQLKNCETKRSVVFNEPYQVLPSAAYNYTYSYVNIFSLPPGTGTSMVLGQGVRENQFTGDEIMDPLFVARLRYSVSWRDMYASAPGHGFVGVKVHAWLIATNDQDGVVTPAPVDMGFTGDGWFLQPAAMSAQMNGDNVRVIRHWSRTINPPSILGTNGDAETVVTHKMVVKLKGKKQYEDQPANASGVPAQYLRGWNYFFVVGWGVDQHVSLLNTLTPVIITADRYLYFKDP